MEASIYEDSEVHDAPNAAQTFLEENKNCGLFNVCHSDWEFTEQLSFQGLHQPKLPKLTYSLAQNVVGDSSISAFVNPQSVSESFNKVPIQQHDLTSGASNGATNSLVSSSSCMIGDSTEYPCTNSTTLGFSQNKVTVDVPNIGIIHPSTSIAEDPKRYIFCSNNDISNNPPDLTNSTNFNKDFIGNAEENNLSGTTEHFCRHTTANHAADAFSQAWICSSTDRNEIADIISPADGLPLVYHKDFEGQAQVFALEQAEEEPSEDILDLSFSEIEFDISSSPFTNSGTHWPISDLEVVDTQASEKNMTLKVLSGLVPLDVSDVGSLTLPVDFENKNFKAQAQVFALEQAGEELSDDSLDFSFSEVECKIPSSTNRNSGNHRPISDLKVVDTQASGKTMPLKVVSDLVALDVSDVESLPLPADVVNKDFDESQRSISAATISISQTPYVDVRDGDSHLASNEESMRIKLQSDDVDQNDMNYQANNSFDVTWNADEHHEHGVELENETLEFSKLGRVPKSHNSKDVSVVSNRINGDNAEVPQILIEDINGGDGHEICMEDHDLYYICTIRQAKDVKVKSPPTLVETIRGNNREIYVEDNESPVNNANCSLDCSALSVCISNTSHRSDALDNSFDISWEHGIDHR